MSRLLALKRGDWAPLLLRVRPNTSAASYTDTFRRFVRLSFLQVVDT